MQEFLNQISEELIYTGNEIEDDTIYIYCEKEQEENMQVHQTTVKKVKDLPFGQYKTILCIKVRRYKENDNNNGKKTRTENFDFLNSTKRRTQRLDDYLYNMMKEGNFIGTERTVKNNTVDISDTSLLRIFKKKGAT